MISKGTQTDIPPEASCTRSSSRPTVPTQNPLLDPHPIIKENFVCRTPSFPQKQNPSPSRPSSSTSHDATSKDPQPKKTIPSLPSLNVPPPFQVNPRTLEFLRDTAEYGCWNCDETYHRHLEYSYPLRLFCFGCERKGFSKASCPKCVHTLL